MILPWNGWLMSENRSMRQHFTCPHARSKINLKQLSDIHNAAEDLKRKFEDTCNKNGTTILLDIKSFMGNGDTVLRGIETSLL